ncbi:MAG TPA: 4'-phosphopantetheinyl transferase superfamily protein [Hyphomonas sp.]|nr:4'-phosphopantetheinyl transferase superfamily protein [Hyphomonas sp.]
MPPDFIPVFGSPAPGPGRTGVWLWRSLTEGSLEAVLSPDETARVGRLRIPDRQSQLAHALAERRHLLAVLLDKPASGVRVSHDDDGKPLLPDFPGFDISLSDSHGWNALALSPAGAVGVDLEVVRPMDWAAMVPMICDPEEVDAALRTIRAADEPAGFFRCWTVKEAVLKAAGTGLRGNARAVPVPTEILGRAAAAARIERDGVSYAVEVAQHEGVVIARALRS